VRLQSRTFQPKPLSLTRSCRRPAQILAALRALPSTVGLEKIKHTLLTRAARSPPLPASPTDRKFVRRCCLQRRLSRSSYPRRPADAVGDSQRLKTCPILQKIVAKKRQSAIGQGRQHRLATMSRGLVTVPRCAILCESAMWDEARVRALDSRNLLKFFT